MKLLTRLVVATAACMLVPIGGVAGVAAAAVHGKSPKIEVTATPNALIETGESEVHAVVQVEALAGYAGDSVNVSSIQLTNSCEYVTFTSIASGVDEPATGNPITVTLDNEGNATVTVDAWECAPGNDLIEADLTSTPYLTATTKLVVKSPHNTPHGVTAYPSKEVETGTSGEGGNSDVYAVFEVETSSKYAEQTVEIQSDELVDRCGAGSYWTSNDGTSADSTTATATLDDNGAAVFDFFGASCASGRSTIIADVEAGLHPTYTTSFKVLSPRPTI